MTARQTHRRDDIDGLRGVAVAAIVVFHVAKSSLPGGFAGVDVFFVISGMLITSIIRGEMENEVFSFANFYARRVKRIVPALAVMLLFSLATAFLVYKSESFSIVGASIAAMLSASNFFQCFLDRSDYFAPSAELLPLNHLWSLGVEEQFYFLWPLAMWLFVGHRWFKFGVMLVVLMSFVLSVVLTDAAPMIAYYMLPTRCGSILMGALVVLQKDSVKLLHREVLSTFSMLAIIACFFFLSESGYPGWHAVAPSVATSMLLATCEQTSVGRILALEPLRKLGRISYSVYLYHWPILAFLRVSNLEFSGFFNLSAIFLYICVSGIMSYSYVEQPVLDLKFISARKVFLWCFLVPFCCVSLALVIFTFARPLGTEVVPLSEGDRPYQKFIELGTKHFPPCVFANGVDHSFESFKAALDMAVVSNSSCFLGDRRKRGSVLLIGDSHAPAYAGMLEEFAISMKMSFFAVVVNGCHPFGPFIMHGHWFYKPNDRSCGLVRQYLHDRWHMFETIIVAIRFSQPVILPKRAVLDGMRLFLRDCVSRRKKVVILGETPTLKYFHDSCLMIRANGSQHSHCNFVQGLKKWEESEACLNRNVRDVISEFPNVTYWDANDYICPGGMCSLYNQAHVRAFSDQNHRWYGVGRIDGIEYLKSRPVPDCFRRAFLGTIPEPSG
jgi:peptidoglycan/LPS O-acetylase OafA/YrhL